MDYDLELDKAVDGIRKNKAKIVLIQLPDGLAPRAGEIQDYIESKTDAEVVIWGQSCYGACDTPAGIEGIDMLIQWGHSKWT